VNTVCVAAQQVCHNALTKEGKGREVTGVRTFQGVPAASRLLQHDHNTYGDSKGNELGGGGGLARSGTTSPTPPQLTLLGALQVLKVLDWHCPSPTGMFVWSMSCGVGVERAGVHAMGPWPWPQQGPENSQTGFSVQPGPLAAQAGWGPTLQQSMAHRGKSPDTNFAQEIFSLEFHFFCSRKAGAFVRTLK